nr:hypothetical protein [Rhodopirellula sp. SM50]
MYDSQQSFVVEWLLKESNRTRLKCLIPRLFVLKGRHKDDGKSPASCLEITLKLQAASAG